MRYFKVSWYVNGKTVFSDPLSTWIDAELYRRDMVALGYSDATILRYGG